MRRIFCVVFLLVTVRLCWAGSIGTSGGPILRQPIGARQIGMGEAFVAVADDVNTIYWNPAGLSFLVAPEVSAMYSKSIVDTTYGTFAFNYPIYKGGIFGQRRNAIGLGFVFLNGGDIDIIMGSPTSTPERLKAEQDYVFILGYSEMLSELKLFGKPGNLFMGLNAKLIRSTLAEDYSATAFAFDYGHFYQTGKISVGFVLQNKILLKHCTPHMD
ncbi:unnamed protein product [marine sediment metagenome]|uniref:PorV/PorQ family protein n=1 Tax=marine sediment metagenome TaxID=412755 RepID=X1MI97_9ZZZZ